MQVVSSETVKFKQIINKSGRSRVAPYIGMPGICHDGPQVFLVEMIEPGATITPHFHDIDQFQVVVEGDGKIGKKQIKPVLAQYADAYTPYGPIVAKDHGLSFFTVRVAASTGFFQMPGSRDKMPGRAGRNLAGLFDPKKLKPIEGVARSHLIEPLDDGLMIDGIHLAPNQEMNGIPSSGGGQYYIISGGTLVGNGKVLPRLSLLHVEPDETPPKLRAGAEGADLVFLQFPRPSDRPGSNPALLAERPKTYALPPGTMIVD